MSNESYSDYAVLTKEGLGANLGAHASDLRIVAFQSPVSLSNALKGVLGEDSDKCPMDALACPWDTSNVELQHESDGYVRVVGKMITDHLEADLTKRIAKSFALVKVGAGSSSGNGGGGGQSVSSVKARAEVPFKYGPIRKWTTVYNPLILEATQAGASGNSLSVQFEVVREFPDPEDEYYSTYVLHVKVFDSSSATPSTPVFHAVENIGEPDEYGHYIGVNGFNSLSDNDNQSISITDYVTAVGGGEAYFKAYESLTLQLSTETHASAQYNGLTFTAVRNGSAGNSLRVEFYVDDNDNLQVSIYDGDTDIYTASTSDNVYVDENTASVSFEAFLGLYKDGSDGEEYMGDYVVVTCDNDDEPSIEIPTGEANKVTVNLSGGGVDTSASPVQEPAESPSAQELSIEEVYAVASIEKGYDLGERNFVAFTITTVNNYKSVSFNPNAFATVEDLGSINGLDGLHIAYDKTSGDIKLIDKDGKVLDQTNIGIDSDTIIADGDEGYKYVKTDRDQDIHSAKAFMPDGKTAWESVEAAGYEVQKAALLVDLRDLNDAIDSAESALGEAESELADAQGAVDAAQQALDENDDPSAVSGLEEALSSAQSALSEKESALEEARDALDEANADFDEAVQAVRRGDYSNVLGIRVISEQGESHTDYFIGGSYNNSKIDASNVSFLAEMESDAPEGLTPVYSQSAFVWTVGKDVGEAPESGEDDTRSFAQQMNANAQALGFHIGDDIPLGTNIADLLEEMADGDDFDTEAYMHGGDDEDYIDEIVDEQRNLAKAELVAWNAQHPALEHDEFNGTIISKEGVDIKNGTIRIGNGTANDNGVFTKQFEISTNLPERTEAPNEHHGLNIALKDASDGHFHEIVTITDVNYISGAPECLALLKFVPAFDDQTSGSSVITPARVETKRITANFSVEGSESNGVFSITITDNRDYTRIHTEDHIVEIIPVYKPGADPDESVPALQPIHTIGEVTNHAGIGEPARLAIDVRCTQVLDWAQSIGLPQSIVQEDPQVIPAQPSSSLYLIVKLY